MKERDVILVPLPQSDGQRKPRPAVILRILPPFGDFLVCGISSQLHNTVPELDDLILRSHADFARTGLRADSLIRTGFLAVYARSQVVGSIGEIAPDRHGRVLKRLADFLIASAPTA